MSRTTINTPHMVTIGNNAGFDGIEIEAKSITVITLHSTIDMKNPPRVFFSMELTFDDAYSVSQLKDYIHKHILNTDNLFEIYVTGSGEEKFWYTGRFHKWDVEDGLLPGHTASLQLYATRPKNKKELTY